MVIMLDLPEAAVDRLQTAADLRGSDLQAYTMSALLEIADRDFQNSFDDAAWWAGLSPEAQQSEIAVLQRSFDAGEAGRERSLVEYTA